MTTLEEMTKQALIDLIKALIDERNHETMFDKFEIGDEDDEEIDPRTRAEFFRDFEKNRWTPPPGAKSALELLREDRDS